MPTPKERLEARLKLGPIQIPDETRSPNLGEWDVLSIVCNPVYAGIPPYPKITEEETWIKSFVQASREYGLENALKVMLSSLRQAMEMLNQGEG